MPAHPTRQLLPARRPSKSNLRWAELSVRSVMHFGAGVKVLTIRDAKWWQRDPKWFSRLTNNKWRPHPPPKRHANSFTNILTETKTSDSKTWCIHCLSVFIHPRVEAWIKKIVLKNCVLQLPLTGSFTYACLLPVLVSPSDTRYLPSSEQKFVSPH